MIKKVSSIVLIGFFLVLFASDIYCKSHQQYTIGISAWTGYPESIRGFKEGLRIGGLTEGKNLSLIFRKSDADPFLQQQIAQEFKDKRVDLVYSLTTPGTTVIKEILPPTTPIVFSIVTYPADSGLIESFEYSGNNLVGTSNYVPLPYYVSMLKTILPKAKTVAIFHRKNEPNSKIQAANMIRLFKKAGINTIDMQPETLEQIRTMASDVAHRADAFMTTTDTLLQGGGEKVLIEISRLKSIPILSSNKSGIEQGSTFGLVADFYILGKIAGEMATKILINNISPALLHSKLQDPPQALINRKSAKKLNIKIPIKGLHNAHYIE